MVAVVAGCLALGADGSSRPATASTAIPTSSIAAVAIRPDVKRILVPPATIQPTVPTGDGGRRAHTNTRPTTRQRLDEVPGSRLGLAGGRLRRHARPGKSAKLAQFPPAPARPVRRPRCVRCLNAKTSTLAPSSPTRAAARPTRTGPSRPPARRAAPAAANRTQRGRRMWSGPHRDVVPGIVPATLGAVVQQHEIPARSRRRDPEGGRSRSGLLLQHQPRLAADVGTRQVLRSNEEVSTNWVPDDLDRRVVAGGWHGGVMHAGVRGAGQHIQGDSTPPTGGAARGDGLDSSGSRVAAGRSSAGGWSPRACRR